MNDTAAQTEETAAPTFKMPAGFEVVSDDVEAYWEPNMGPLLFIPKTVRLMDNTQDKKKSSALILGELKQDATLMANAPKKEDRTPQEFKAGAAIGIWAKAGMRELSRLGGAVVWIAPDGKRPMGGGKNDMQLFKIAKSAASTVTGGLSLTEDARKTSVTEPADAKLEGNSSPWWLSVLDDGGMARATQAMQDRARAISDAPAA